CRDHVISLSGFLLMTAKTGADRIETARSAVSAKTGKKPAAGCSVTLVFLHQYDHVFGAVNCRVILDIEKLNYDAAPLGKSVIGKVAALCLFVGINVVNAKKKRVFVCDDLAFTFLPRGISFGKRWGRSSKSDGVKAEEHGKQYDS